VNIPELEYQRRLVERQRTVEAQKVRYARLGNWRVTYALAASAGVWTAGAYGFRQWPVLVFGALAIMIALLVIGSRMEWRISLASRAVEYYRRAASRVRSRRNHQGETGERFLDPQHPYAIDLDVFGKHSLFQLLSVCRTRAGENRLADWLRSPADASEIRSRHEAVNDMRERLDLREDLAVLGEDFRSGVNPEALVRWATAAPVRIPAMLRWVAMALSGVGVILIGALTLTLFSDPRLRIALIAVALTEAAIFFRWREVVSRIAQDAEDPGHDLGLLAAALARIEREQFISLRLARMRTALDEPQQASSAIRTLGRCIELLESRDNLFLRIFGPLILWTTQVSFAVELWRQRNGHAIPQWLDALAEFEAIGSLAAAAYEHPEDVLPEILRGAPCLRARGLAHPLLADCVPNDVELGGERSLLIVSGSNMSGKSTLLRTVGLNAVLALAGAPVRAVSLQISELSIGASIRTSDSLEGGISRFYAEILRIRQILELRPPVLFLLDELLAGTNSHDRRIGAEAILRGLVERGAMGLATTHDLALSRARNVHFEDSIQDGRITFDYRMRPGVVTRSNALELMRSVGLEV
jgi:hypothetical protein